MIATFSSVMPVEKNAGATAAPVLHKLLFLNGFQVIA
jgi:hypothetical protein